MVKMFKKSIKTLNIEVEEDPKSRGKKGTDNRSEKIRKLKFFPGGPISIQLKDFSGEQKNMEER